MSKLNQRVKKTSNKCLSRGLQTISTLLADRLAIRPKKSDVQEAETTTGTVIGTLERETGGSIVEIESEIVIEMIAEKK